MTLRSIAVAPAFTVIELLVVLALLGVLASGIVQIGRGGGRAVALRTAQATLAGALAQARSEAAARGTNVGLLVHADAVAPDRRLREWVVAVEDPVHGWQPLTPWLALPAGVALLPSVTPAGDAIEDGTDWTGLRSSGLGGTTVMCDGVAALPIVFTARGTVFRGAGDFVLAPVERLPADGAEPWRYLQPDAVRGLSLSVYGLVTFLHERSEM